MDQPVRRHSRVAVFRRALTITCDATDPAAQPARVRAFVAAFVSAADAKRLQAASIASLDASLLNHRDVRLVPPPNYHVTLKFLGEVEQAALADAARAVASLPARETSARASGLTGLPRSAGARLMAAELSREADLQAWWSALQSLLGTESRGFRPHVTVVRFRRPRRCAATPLPEALTVTLGPPRLYRSDQTRDGVRYSPVVLT